MAVLLPIKPRPRRHASSNAFLCHVAEALDLRRGITGAAFASKIRDGLVRARVEFFLTAEDLERLKHGGKVDWRVLLSDGTAPSSSAS